jgi:cell division protein FtsI (penicillin-binding protein 3)
MDVKKDITWRVNMAYLAVVLVCIVIFGKAVYIQQMQGTMWRNLSDSLHLKMMDVEADRGTIYSADGQMLSTSVPQYDIYIDFGADGLREHDGELFKANLDTLSLCLANLFKDKTKGGYKAILNKGYKEKDRYSLLKRKVSFSDYQELKKFPLVRLGKNKSGFIANNTNVRLNPYQLLAFRTIGLERENAKKIGLEQSYDSLLRGKEGKRLVRFIAGGVAVPVDDDYEVEPENGEDIVSTIDTRIQEISENALLDMMQQSQSKYGTCIVMETTTGQIKAIANLGQQANGSYWEDYNYALRATEPGSTIKLATLLSVLSEGRTSINDLVEVGSTGNAFVGVRNVNDAERAPKPIMTVKECFAHSSNVGFSKIAYNTFAGQPSKYIQYLHQYRMDTVSGIDLKGEDKPKLAKVSKSHEGLSELETMSFGYSLQVTPMQTLTLYNAIANNGKMVKPYLITAVQQDGKLVKQFNPVVLTDNFCTPSVIKAAQECMNAVVTEGTAKGIFINTPYKVAGKTGTAHVADGKYGYSDGIYLASFVGYFPADKPRYTCIVVIRTNPYAPLHYGGQLAAPVFKTIADRLYTMFVQSDEIQHTNTTINDSIPYLYTGKKSDIQQIMEIVKMPYKDSSIEKTDMAYIRKENAKPVMNGVTIDKKTMPQLNGMTLKDAVYLCENIGMKINVKGKGKVISQSYLPGQPIIKGLTVNIELN